MLKYFSTKPTFSEFTSIINCSQHPLTDTGAYAKKI